MDVLATKVDHLKMVVFDLDYTLWPFWVDTHVTPPFRKVDNKVFDRDRQHVKHYAEVPDVLERLSSLGYKLAVASRTGATKEAEHLLHLFDWNQYFTYKEIYPGSKVRHINSICEQSGVKRSEVIFFDDEHRNIRDLSGIQVCSILVNNGVNFNVVRSGIESFLSRRST